MNRAELWDSFRKITKQIFDLVTECKVTRSEAYGMTNLERVAWLTLQKEKIDEQRKEQERERAKAKARTPSRGRRR